MSRVKWAPPRSLFGRPRRMTPQSMMARAMAKKQWVPRRSRGYMRTGGYYGRFARNGGKRGAELKFHDVDLDDASVANSATITDSVNKIAQGVTESTRVGRKCTLRSINWRWRLQLPNGTASASTSDTVRIIMYLDKQCNGATATAAAILESDDFQSFNNLANKSRFRTLMDRTYTINSKSGGGDGTTEDYGKEGIDDSFYKRVNIPIEFDSTQGAITEIRSNNVGVLLISESGLCGFASKMRLRFSDD